MALLPRRAAERRLRLPLFPLLVQALVGPAAVSAAAAQEAPDPGPSRAAAVLEAGVGLTTLDGRVASHLAGAALVALSPIVSVGGGGTYFPSRIDVEGDAVFPDRALGFGYGGVLVEVSLPWLEPQTDVVARSLLGAGHADLRDRPTGTRLGSDNVVVLEPGLVLRRQVFPRLGVGISLSWRSVLGLEDIDGVGSSDLSGGALGLHLRLGPL